MNISFFDWASRKISPDGWTSALFPFFGGHVYIKKSEECNTVEYTYVGKHVGKNICIWKYDRISSNQYTICVFEIANKKPTRKRTYYYYASLIQRRWREILKHRRIRAQFAEWLDRPGNPGFWKLVNDLKYLNQ